jgi:hypothetical protein
MTPTEIEGWTHAVIERVVNGQPVEDSRVELKAEWPADYRRAARRIAGHANAARGEPILWIFGVDEETRLVRGVEAVEFANWFAGVRTCFNELPPEVTDVVVHSNGRYVVALVFPTDRAPYVVNNPEGGPFQRDVPWREGTAVSSATREQLFRLLVPVVKLPKILPQKGTIKWSRRYPMGEPQNWKIVWECDVILLIIQSQDHQTVALASNSYVDARIEGCDWVRLQGNHLQLRGPAEDRVSAIVSLVGPHLFSIKATCEVLTGAQPPLPNGRLAVRFIFDFPGQEKSAMCESEFYLDDGVSQNERCWRLGSKPVTPKAPVFVSKSGIV